MIYGILMVAIIGLLFFIEHNNSNHNLQIIKIHKDFRELVKKISYSDDVYLLSDKLPNGKEKLKILKNENKVYVENGIIKISDNDGNDFGIGTIFVDRFDK